MENSGSFSDCFMARTSTCIEPSLCTAHSISSHGFVATEVNNGDTNVICRFFSVNQKMDYNYLEKVMKRAVDMIGIVLGLFGNCERFSGFLPPLNSLVSGHLITNI